MPRTKAAKCAKQTKRTPVGGASGAQVRAVRKRAVGAGRTKAARLKRANPKASRKKAAPVKSTSKMKSDAAAGRRMSNFNTSLRKNKAPVKQKSAKSPVAEKALVKKEGMSKSLKKPASKASPVTTTTSTVFAVISTTSSAECATTSSQKVSIAMYREAGAQRKSRDLEHIADSIERVVSASHEWPVDATPGDARRSRSASSSDSSDVAINARRSKSASKRAPKRAPSPPPRRRLASLNALAKVHCLYESEARGASRKRASDTSSSDSTDSSDATSDSSSDSSDARRRREPDARRAKAAPVKKRPKPAKKRTAVKKPRRSMEVSAASLVQLVTPKRMASLNATAILAASSQHWSDSRSRRKNQTRVDTESDSDTDEGNKTQEDDDKEKGGARGGRREGEPRPFASAIVTSSVRVSTVIQQQADGGGKQTTTKSTFLAHESTVGPGATKKSFQQHVTCLKVSPSDADDVGGVDQCEESSSSKVRGVGPGHYSPLGALYNMRPPNARHDAGAECGGVAGPTSPDASPVLNAPGSPPTASSRGVHVKERDKMWLPASDRLVASSMPSVHFGGVPFMLSNQPVHQSPLESLHAARFSAPYPPHRDIPYAPLYPPTAYQTPAHLAAPPYYRGFALLPPPAPGFVPVALADGYSTYADLSYYLQRYPGAVGAPCGALARYLPAPCSFAGGADWRPGGEVRPVTELSGASSSSSGAGWSRPGRAMHDDRGLLPLAGVEAAAASTSGSASPSTSAASTSVGPKLEAGAAGFCPLDAPFPGRCLPGNCSCSGQRTLHCPKNVLAGPLTGEGNRSEPNSPSQSVTPHRGVRGATLQSPQVPCLPPPELLYRAAGPLEAAVGRAKVAAEANNNDGHGGDRNDRNDAGAGRKRAATAGRAPEPVASRLRPRLGSTSASCTCDCTKECCRPDGTSSVECEPSDAPKKSSKARKMAVKSSDEISDDTKRLKKSPNTCSSETEEVSRDQSVASETCTLRPEAKRGRSKSRSPLVPPLTTPTPTPSPSHPRWSNGWSWVGAGHVSLVHVTNDEAPVPRRCYRAMRHRQGDVVHTRDCILLKSGPKAKDLPFVAKVCALWENAHDGEMMVSLLWYYRPEHTDEGRSATDLDDEIFASRHRDVCSVACVEDKCYVLTFNEYCRHRKTSKLVEEGFASPPSGLVPPAGDASGDYPRRKRLPSARTPADRVFLCRKVYDFRQKRILKNPA